MPAGRFNLNLQLLVSALASLVIFTVLISLGFGLFQTWNEESRLAAYAEEVANRLSRNLITPIWTVNQEYVETIIIYEMDKPEIIAIRVSDPDGMVIAATTRTKLGIQLGDGETALLLDTMNPQTAISDIWKDSYNIGSVQVKVARLSTTEWLGRESVPPLILSLLVGGLAIATLLLDIRVRIIKRLNILAIQVEQLGNGMPIHPVEVKGKDEISHLAQSLNSLAKSTETQTRQLTTQINDRTSQLAETDKMAFIGKLVSGFAHELGSPLGVCTTATSFLKNAHKEFGQKFSEGTLTRSQTEKFVTELGSALDMMEFNLDKATMLVTTFKSVGNDQVNSQNRVFNLAEYIESILLVLKPHTKHKPHTISVNIDPNIMVNAPPSIFYQAVSQFLMNSIQHGYPDGKQGTMEIDILVNSQGLSLRYRDDGIGLGQEDIDNLFKPLKSSKREHLGLGLYTLMNMVQRAKGTLVYLPRTGGGVEFRMNLPADIII